ncbi:ATPase [Candidatus Peregrinibacteria bacterium CG_4_10_14_0_2_um_filter_43_11]|nr:MAG: ATPase [Candidatus Peregrinibacteria bacterium CG_4_10_14_0_2_um_filter_43_11]
MKTYIPRDIYLKRIEPFIDKDVIKVLVGQRRVGKSYLLFQIMDLIKKKHKNPNIVYINKELNEFENILNHKDLLEFIGKKVIKNVKTYVFIDEIQDIGQFEKALRSLQAEGLYDIYCTGSNANLFSGELATYLSGRYIEIKVYSLSYEEFLRFKSLDSNKESLLKFIKYGGLPYLIHLPLEDEVIYDYLSNIYSAILFKDIIKRHRVRNAVILERLIEFLTDNVGSFVTAKRISDFLKSQKIKISPSVILNYLQYLSAAFFIFKVQRSEVGGRKIFEINEKYYFEDLGLKHSIRRYNNNDINKVLENLVFMHMKICGYSITVGQIGSKEIDFVCSRGEEKIYIQVAYIINDEKTREREFGNLLGIKDNYKKIVVSMDEMGEGNFKGIRQINITDFLSKYW